MYPTHSNPDPARDPNHNTFPPSTQEGEITEPQALEDLSPDLTLSEYMSDHSLRPRRLSGSSTADPGHRERCEALAAELEGLVETGEAIGLGEMGRVGVEG